MMETLMDTIDTAVQAPEARLNPRGRRSYSVEEKLRIVQETHKPGASVSVVARRHDVNANMVFTWRRQHQRGSLVSRPQKSRKPRLLPVIVPSGEAEQALRKGELAGREVSPTPTGRIEIEFPGGGRLRVDGIVNADTLRAAIRELSQP
jgi:transposase